MAPGFSHIVSHPTEPVLSWVDNFPLLYISCTLDLGMVSLAEIKELGVCSLCSGCPVSWVNSLTLLSLSFHSVWLLWVSSIIIVSTIIIDFHSGISYWNMIIIQCLLHKKLNEWIKIRVAKLSAVRNLPCAKSGWEQQRKVCKVHH